MEAEAEAVAVAEVEAEALLLLLVAAAGDVVAQRYLWEQKKWPWFARESLLGAAAQPVVRVLPWLHQEQSGHSYGGCMFGRIDGREPLPMFLSIGSTERSSTITVTNGCKGAVSFRIAGTFLWLFLWWIGQLFAPCVCFSDPSMFLWLFLWWIGHVSSSYVFIVVLW